MNTKFSKLFATVLIAAMALGIVSIIATPNARAQSTPPASPSFYVNPASETFYTSSTPVGTLFNVTIMIATPNGTAAWSIQVGFNASLLQVVGAGFTASATSMLFQGHSSTPAGPVIDNVGTTSGYAGVGSVEMGETLLGTDYVNASTASLAWITFNVTAAPKSGNFTDLIDPGFGLQPGVAETYIILQSPTTTYPTGEIDSPNTAPCTYTYAAASKTPPTISSVTQTPTSVNDSVEVSVTANITDNSGTGLQNATLLYSTDNATWTPVTMSLNGAGLYGANITGEPGGTTVYYEIEAYDNAGNMAIQYETSYTVVPEFANVALLVIMMAIVLASAVLITLKKRGR